MPRPSDRCGVPNPDGRWDVQAVHAERSSKYTPTQAEAIGHAKEIVRNAGGGGVRIQGRDGCFRDSSTVTRRRSLLTATPNTEAMKA